MNDSFFRQLTPSEEADFRQWARDNFDKNKEADPCWHPCVRDEWQKLARNDVGYFYFEAQTGIIRDKRPLAPTNFYNYRLPDLLRAFVQEGVEKATPTTHGLEYKDQRFFLAELEEYDTERTIQAICEDCKRSIPDRDIRMYQNEAGNSSLPRVCEDCAEKLQ